MSAKEGREEGSEGAWAGGARQLKAWHAGCFSQAKQHSSGACAATTPMDGASRRVSGKRWHDGRAALCSRVKPGRRFPLSLSVGESASFGRRSQLALSDQESGGQTWRARCKAIRKVRSSLMGIGLIPRDGTHGSGGLGSNPAGVGGGGPQMSQAERKGEGAL